jgi:hypothetical protein
MQAVETQVVESTAMCGNGCEGEDTGGHSEKSKKFPVKRST